MHKIEAAREHVDKSRYGLRIILVIPIDRHDAFIALVQGVGIGASELGAEFSRSGFKQQVSHPHLLKEAQFQRAVLAAAIHDDDVGQAVDFQGGHARKQVPDSSALIDDRNHHAPGMQAALRKPCLERRDLPGGTCLWSKRCRLGHGLVNSHVR
ncbi:hypothetical protein D3C71_1623960 [compost metagenome]